MKRVDGVGFTIAGFSLLVAMVLAGYVRPTYARMFEDFDAALPWLTRVMMHGWVLLLIGALPLFVTIEGLVRDVAFAGKTIRLFVASTLTVLGFVAFLIAMYLPVFSIAGDVK